MINFPPDAVVRRVSRAAKAAYRKRKSWSAVARAALLASGTGALVASLEAFLEDDRFSVSVGGNPLAVEKMLADARSALAKAQGDGHV